MKHFSLTPRKMRSPLPCELPTLEDIDGTPCIPMKRDKTLCEDLGITPMSTADEYCKIIETYKRGFIKERECWSKISRLGRTSA